MQLTNYTLLNSNQVSDQISAVKILNLDHRTPIICSRANFVGKVVAFQKYCVADPSLCPGITFEMTGSQTWDGHQKIVSLIILLRTWVGDTD